MSLLMFCPFKKQWKHIAIATNTAVSLCTICIAIWIPTLRINLLFKACWGTLFCRLYWKQTPSTVPEMAGSLKGPYVQLMLNIGPAPNTLIQGRSSAIGLQIHQRHFSTRLPFERRECWANTELLLITKCCCSSPADTKCSTKCQHKRTTYICVTFEPCERYKGLSLE